MIHVCFIFVCKKNKLNLLTSYPYCLFARLDDGLEIEVSPYNVSLVLRVTTDLARSTPLLTGWK